MFPSHLDSGFHIDCQDNKLRRPAVAMGAKTYDVDLSHSGRENSEKMRREQGGRPTFLLCCIFSPVALDFRFVTNNRFLYVFLDEAGNLSFDLNGTRYFSLTSITLDSLASLSPLIQQTLNTSGD